MSLGIGARGAQLQIGDGGGPENFTTIAEVTNIDGPNLSQEAIEITHHQSPGGWKEFVGGLLEGGEVTLSVNLIPTHATHSGSTGILADLKNRVVRNFKLIFPDASSTTWSFAALVTGFVPGLPVEGKLTGEITLQISGQPTLA